MRLTGAALEVGAFTQSTKRWGGEKEKPSFIVLGNDFRGRGAEEGSHEQQYPFQRKEIFRTF